MSKSEVLAALMLNAPSTWLVRDSDGQRLFDSLHAQLTRAGLTPAIGGGEDVTMLHAIFDVLLREGCGEVVVDWIVEVCGDPRAASADPLEAHLMDGRCVQQWAGGALQQCQARLMQALQRGLAVKAAPGVVHGEAGYLHTLLHILQALSDGGGSSDLTEAQRLADAADAAAWATRALPLAKGRWGTMYSSSADWRAAVNRRRDAAAPRQLLIHSLLEELRQQGCSTPSYPFASLEEALGLFLSGPTSHTAARARLAAFVYALTDAGFTVEEDSMRSSFGVKAGETSAWVAAVWLDQGTCGASAAQAVSAARASVPSGLTARHLGFEAVAALEGIGAPDVALVAARCCHQPGSSNCGGDASLPEAQTLLRARLSCGLLTEAIVEAAHFLESATAADSASAALAEQLAEWGASSRQLSSIAMLPLPGRLEAAMVKWLGVAIGEGRPGSSQLPLFLLQRGRLAEADAASSAVEDAIAAGVLQETERETQGRRALISASRQLLPTTLTSPLASVGLQSLYGQPHEHVVAESALFHHSRQGSDSTREETSDSVQPPSGPETSPSPSMSLLPAADEDSQESGAVDRTERSSQPARTMQTNEFREAMGTESSTPGRSTGPRTRQMAKRQRLPSQLR